MFLWLVVVQSLSRVQLFATPWTAAHQASLSSTISQSLFKFTSIESVLLSNHLILYCPLLLLPSIFPSIRALQSGLHIKWPKYWSFTISPTYEYSWLISFRIDWFDLPEAQRQEAPKSRLDPFCLVKATRSLQPGWKRDPSQLCLFPDLRLPASRTEKEICCL